MSLAGALVAFVRNASAHIAYQFAHQCKPKPLALRFTRHERLEYVIAQKRIDSFTCRIASAKPVASSAGVASTW